MTQRTENHSQEIVYVQSPPGMMPQEDDEIDLLELWNVIWNAKFFIAGFSLVATVLAVVITLYVLPVTYKSDMILQPTQSNSGGGMGGLAALAGNLPFPISMTGNNKSSQILTFLNSRNLQERLIKKYDLLARFYNDQWDSEKKAWKSNDPEEQPSVVKALQGQILKSAYAVNEDTETSLINVSWVDQDPAFAHLMLQRIITELNHYLNNEFEFDAKRERQFVEKQLAKATKELEHWERQVPSQQLTLATILREQMATQTVYTELRKQLELSKITEAKELVRFKVLDPPFTPERKFKPKRSLICALTLVTSGFLAIFLVFLRSAIKGQKSNAAE